MVQCTHVGRTSLSSVYKYASAKVTVSSPAANRVPCCFQPCQKQLGMQDSPARPPTREERGNFLGVLYQEVEQAALAVPILSFDGLSFAAAVAAHPLSSAGPFS